MEVGGIQTGDYSGSLANLTAQAKHAAQVKQQANPVLDGKDVSNVVNKGPDIVRDAVDSIDNRTQVVITKTTGSVIEGNPDLGTRLDIIASLILGYFSFYPSLYQLLQK